MCRRSLQAPGAWAPLPRKLLQSISYRFGQLCWTLISASGFVPTQGRLSAGPSATVEEPLEASKKPQSSTELAASSGATGEAGGLEPALTSAATGVIGGQSRPVAQSRRSARSK